MTYTKSADVDARATDAFRLGRLLAVELPASLARFAAGAVFAKADETTLTLLLAAFRQALNGYGAGYGDLWLREKKHLPSFPVPGA
jgi:hypothetical protein